MRVAYLPRPEFERPGIGSAEASAGGTSSLYSTVSVGSVVSVIPKSINTSSFVYRPKSSSAIITNGSFVADVRGDYVLDLFSTFTETSFSKNSSQCDDSNPALGPETTSLRWAIWDFSSPETVLGVIFKDSFSYRGVSSSESIYELWGGEINIFGKKGEVRGEPVPKCASESSHGLVLFAETGNECTITTRSARINFFSEPVLVEILSIMIPSLTTGRFSLRLVDAYYGIENITLAITGGNYASYVLLSSQNETLSSGSISGVCSNRERILKTLSSVGPFDISVSVDPSFISLIISCSNGSSGSPISVTGLAHGLSYASFGFGASGAMRLTVEAINDQVTLGTISATSLSAPYKAPFELFPIAGRGTFARIRLGALQPRSLIGVIDASSQPFNADPTGTSLSTQALQNAVDFCYLYSCTVYLPVGNYLINDTINMTQLHDLAVDGVVYEGGALHRYYNHILRGEVLNSTVANQRRSLGLPTRSMIVLSPSSVGFTDASFLKAVIWSIALSTTTNGSYINMDDINYCNVVQSIDISIGSGNYGAVGLRFRGAQGTSLEDVTVYIGDGAIGVHGLGGSGGTHSNLTLIGGKFAIDGRVAQPGPTLNAIRIINSTCAGLVYGGAQTLVLVGASFELDSGIPAIVAGNPLPVSSSCSLPSFDGDFGPATSALDGHISIIDSYFKFFPLTSSLYSSTSFLYNSSISSSSYSPICASGSLVISNSYFENAGQGETEL
jgi:hypothetical protein